MLPWKKIELLTNEINELKTSIEEIKKANEHILDFDKLYNEILENYAKSRDLINEQLMQYDKKIMENTSIVDERLLSFQAKIDDAIDNTISNMKTSLVEKSNQIRNELTDFEASLKNNIDTYVLDGEEEIKKRLDDQVEKLTERFDNLINQLEKNWDEIKQKHTIDINEKLSKYEINLNEMINSAVIKELNNIIVEEVANKASNIILDAFNKSLKELNENEKTRIIDAIKGLIGPKLPVKVEKELDSVKPLGKDELFHECYDKLKLCVTSGIIPMIVGPAGTGKSTAAEQLSRDLGLHFYMANRIQNTFELVGFVNAAGEYVTTQFFEAYTKGGIFLFDEVDASSPEALVTINAAIAQGYMAFPGQPKALPMHPDFKAICAGNTFGTGSTLEYTGRNKLDAATLDRFMIIEWGYDTKLEDKLIKDKELLSFCWELRGACSVVDHKIIISTRGIITLEKMLVANKKDKSFDIKDIIRQKFFETTSLENIRKIYSSVSRSREGNPYLKYLEELTK